ncbi:MAG: TonB family protein [Oleiphilaceae bacterium]|nr:TonB family protein [Oleiphilaceae bacterium]
MLARIAVLLPLGMAVCLCLFWLMAKLIEPSIHQPTSSKTLLVVDFLRAKTNSDSEPSEEEKRELADEIPEQPQIAPPALMLPDIANQKLSIEMPLFADEVAIEAPISLAELSFEGINNEATTSLGNSRELVAVRESTLTYPPKAQRRRIEGWVVFNYIVTAEGKVTDVEIVESSPPRIFDRVVLKEVARWEYLPRLVNGQAQATRVVERKYVFQL